jgi:NTE family protein
VDDKLKVSKRLDMMYCSLYSLADHTKFSKEQLNRIQHKYKKYNEEHGAKIKQIYYISRDELFPHIY